MRARTLMTKPGLVAAVLLLLILAAPPDLPAAEGAGGPPFDPGRAGFSVKVKDEVNPYRVLALTAMPGETLRFEIGASEKGEFSAASPAGALAAGGRGKWTWTAPGASGLTEIRIERKEPAAAMIFNVFTLVPRKRIQGGYLNGYRIGEYPATPLRGLAIYRPPRGFIEVTPENRGVAVAPHFTLGQFLCKQESGWPKYLALRERLLLKLEYILNAVNEKGIRTDGFHVMSGFRTPFYNAAIKNVKYSRHMWGGAADIFIDVDPADGIMDDINGDGRADRSDAAFLFEFIESLGKKGSYSELEGGLGDYGSTAAHGPFVHVDARGFRARWRN